MILQLELLQEALRLGHSAIAHEIERIVCLILNCKEIVIAMNFIDICLHHPLVRTGPSMAEVIQCS